MRTGAHSRTVGVPIPQPRLHRCRWARSVRAPAKHGRPRPDQGRASRAESSARRPQEASHPTRPLDHPQRDPRPPAKNGWTYARGGAISKPRTAPAKGLAPPLDPTKTQGQVRYFLVPIRIFMSTRLFSVCLFSYFDPLLTHHVKRNVRPTHAQRALVPLGAGAFRPPDPCPQETSRASQAPARRT